MSLIYFPIRGRAEPVRLALAAAGESWNETVVDYAEMKGKAGTAEFPFGQVPVFDDGKVRLAQMDAIVRYVGRVHGMYGATAEEASFIDMILLAVEDSFQPYVKLCYTHSFSEEAKKEYVTLHIDAAGTAARNGGAHFQYLENILARSESFATSGFVVGGKPTIADVQLFNLVDLHLRPVAFPEQMKAFPNLVKLHETFAAIPSVAAYLTSDKRHAKINGNDLG